MFLYGKMYKCNGHTPLLIQQLPFVYCPGDGTGIRVGLRNQILGVRVSSGAPCGTVSRIGIAAAVLKTEGSEKGV